MKPGFSIVICCYNSASRITETVAYVRRLKTDAFGFEIIVVDNNSSDNTYQLAMHIASTVGEVEMNVVSETAAGKTNALISGIRSASYEYILVCDDDNWLHEDYLLIAWQVMQGDPLIGILGGRGVIHSEAVLPAWFSTLQNAWAIGSQAEQSGEVSNAPKAVWGAGMVIRSIAWNDVFKRGFKQFLTGRRMENLAMAGEDTELCILVHAIGYTIHYEEKMWYFHQLHESRLSWRSLKNLWEGFARSSVYFEMYIYYFSLKRTVESREAKRKFRVELMENVHAFFSASSPLNFLKIIYIAFIEDREGYLAGLEKRKFLYRLKELWRIRKSYGESLQAISAFQPGHFKKLPQPVVTRLSQE